MPIAARHRAPRTLAAAGLALVVVLAGAVPAPAVAGEPLRTPRHPPKLRVFMEALATVDSFAEMVGSRGTIEGDEDILGDGIAFVGVSKYPARVKCALLGWMAFKDAVVRADPGAEATA